LAALIARSSEARRELYEALSRLNAAHAKDVPRHELDELIQQQYWRVAHFRVAGDDINYRRFFNINDLAGLRIELPDVFEHAHHLVFQLLRAGILDGLRIDHIDGLLDPASYLNRVRATAFVDPLDPQSKDSGKQHDFYLVVEKILARGETLRDDWPVDGTTGYEFANLVLGLLIDPAGEQNLTRCYAEFSGETRPFAEIVRDSKLRIMNHEMASELNVLARDAARVARQNPRTADFTRNILYLAIRELVACFPVYRTYVNAQGTVSAADLSYVEQALTRARRNEREIDPSVFDFLEQLLSGQLIVQRRSGFSRHTVLRCAMKLQQYSGPVMAKGLEDTAFYRYNRFIALNEVGGHPDHFGIALDEFHAANSFRAQRWPNSLLSTSTHDTKRGEDARARLAVLSELPEAWAQHVTLWSRMLGVDGHDGLRVPDANDEYLFYQLLAGTWPAALIAEGQLDRMHLQTYVERLKTVMRKSLREAKQNSTWATPNAAYENGVLEFIERALDSSRSSGFLQSFLTFTARIARLGVHNSLIQTALKLTAPGVPDLYQGTELWNLSMVDPDNRRAVDYATRGQLLDEWLAAATERHVELLRRYLDHWQDGRIKLALTHMILDLRRTHAKLFEKGSYEPCVAQGDKADQIAAFVRSDESSVVLIAVARFPARREFDSLWDNTRIPLAEKLQGKTWRELLTGRKSKSVAAFNAESLFDVLPVAIWVAE